MLRWWRKPFADDTAAKTGRSRRAVERDSTRATHIPGIATLIGTSLDQGDELDAMAKLEPEVQAALIERAGGGREGQCQATERGTRGRR